MFSTYRFELIYRPWKKNDKTDALSGVETEKTEGKGFDKNSNLRPDQIERFNEVDGETSYLNLAINFVDDIK